MLHIAFLTPEYVSERRPEGGLANYLYKVGQGLTERGFHVTVICLSDRNRFWHDSEVSVNEVKRFVFPYQLYRLKSIYPYFPIVAQIISSRRLEKVLWRVHKANPIDLVQVSSYKSPGYTLLHNKRLPIVCRISSSSSLKRSANDMRRNLAEHLLDWLEIRQILDSNASFAPSRFIASIFSRHEGYTPSVIRTPLDTVEITPDPSFYKTHLAGKSYLLYFGSLNRVKGADLLAHAITPLFDKYPGVIFAFIGRDDGFSDSSKIFDYICGVNSKYKDRLFYHPALPKTQLYPVIANAIGILMPSRVDNYPNVCLEAHELGVPVVGTYNSSLDEMIVDSRSGFLAENEDPVSLREAIDKLMALSPKQRRQMRQDISESIRQIRAEDRISELVDFYQTTISEFNSR